MEEISLKVSNVTTSYKTFSLKNINFSLKSGQIMGVIGKSGSGKSTLVNTIVGLKKLDKGEINFYIGDEAVPINKYMGYSSQGNSLFPYLTLKENIITFGKLRRLKKSDILTKMDGLLRTLKLNDAKNKKIIELSGGMAKRADIVVALLHNPKIVILDEPFSGLDFSLIKFIWKILYVLAKQGKIIIVSSHFLNYIQKSCTSVGFISDGSFYDSKEVKSMMKKRDLSSLEDLFMEGV